MNLSRNFTLENFTKNSVAIRLGIDNTPTQENIESMIVLCDNVLQPIWHHFGIVIIRSGFKTEALNNVVGGPAKCQACKGEGAEIEVPGVSNYDLAQWIKTNLEFDQLVLEYHTSDIPDSGWVFVSYQTERLNRNNVLTASKFHSRTSYQVGLIR